MPTLKLTIVTSIYGKPYSPNKSFRRISSLATPTTSSRQRRPPMWARGWRITPCAPLSPPAYHSNNNNNNNNSFLPYMKLGFPRHKTSNSDSPQVKRGVLGGGESLTQMDLPNPNHSLENNRKPTNSTTPPSINNHRHKPSAPPSSQHQSTKLLTLPTILTIGRVAAVPILIGTFYMNSWWGTTATTSIFIAAAITDWLDGYIARKMKLGSAFGAFLDPVADKLMVAATLVLLCTRPPDIALFNQMPWLLTVPSIAIIGREITMSAVREWAASQSGKLSQAVAVNNLGKWKTASQMTALTILLAARDSSLSEAGFLVGSGVTLLYISAVLAVWSLVVYTSKIWKVLIR